MKNNNFDILENIDLINEKKENNEIEKIVIHEEKIEEIDNDFIIEEIEENDNSIILEKIISENIEIINNKEKNKTDKKTNSILSGSIFLVKYLLTTALIFGVLLITTNYNAYLNIAKSYVYSGELEDKGKQLISSVEASNIKEKYSEVKINKIKSTQIEDESRFSIVKMKKEQDKKNINLDIEITPFENRVIIPKIGKNIPLVDIKNRNIKGQKELNNIFMKELEKGIIRYPSSAKPGQTGNSFIFGHSSNFPWVKGDYNDIFALLDKVDNGDEVIVYYGQEKYVYKINGKKIVKPGDVSVLDKNNNKKEISLMTCWPIGTTLNRLIVTGELVEQKK